MVSGWEALAKVHGHIYCSRRGVQCLSVDWDTGECSADKCCLDDPEYIRHQALIQEKMHENYLRRQEEEKHIPRIRRQHYTEEEQIEKKIKEKKAKAAALKRAKKYQAADLIEREIISLTSRLEDLHEH